MVIDFSNFKKKKENRSIRVQISFTFIKMIRQRHDIYNENGSIRWTKRIDFADFENTRERRGEERREIGGGRRIGEQE